MTNQVIQQFEAAQIRGKIIPTFRAGDTVIVKVRVKEGTRERLQAFEGMVLGLRNRGLNSSFTVRKISHGEGVERVFQTYSNLIESITVKRIGDVRRAKLYYLRDLTGKAARIKEKIMTKAQRAKAAEKETARIEAILAADAAAIAASKPAQAAAPAEDNAAVSNEE